MELYWMGTIEFILRQRGVNVDGLPRDVVEKEQE
jgi:hypothetical protein